MTVRKPPGVSWDSWVERQIRESMERGEFDDLPGAGKPLPDIDRPHDDMWWLRDKLRRENLSSSPLLPPTLAVRKELADALARIAKADSEWDVRQIVGQINERIARVNSRTTSGPPSRTMRLDVERIVQEWRNGRS